MKKRLGTTALINMGMDKYGCFFAICYYKTIVNIKHEE